MRRKIPARGTVAACALVLPFAFQFAYADVTLEERVSVEGAGVMSIVNMTGTTVTSISGDRARMDSDMQMQSRMMRMFARDVGPTSEIIRLDRDTVYELDIKKKQYTEVSLAERRAELAKAFEQMKQAQEKQPSPTGMDESQCEWSDPKVDVKKTGAKASIAGFDAEQITIVATQSCKDKRSGAVCDVALSLDQWLAPGLDIGEEHAKFYRAYAEKMGLGPAAQDLTRRAESLFGRYPGVWREVARKMADVKGFPVRTSFALGFGGPQCQSAQESTASLPPAPSAGEMGEAAATAAGQMAGEAAAAKAGQSVLGGVAGQIGGRIAGSLFKRGKRQDAEEAQDGVAAAGAQAGSEGAGGGMITPLRVTSEVVAVKKEALRAETFEVPAGFKKAGNAG